MTTPPSRHYFGTDGIRGRVGHGFITPEFVLKFGWALGCILNQHQKDNKVLIGKDTRISGYLFESALEAGLSAAGVDIHLLGPMPTPAVAYLTRTLRAQAGVMISASHNPYTDNGIKIFSAEGRKFPDSAELAIEAQLQCPIKMVESHELGKAVRVEDAQGRYIEFCKSTVSTQLSLTGMKIAVDCAHGATYHVAPHVFHELGAEVIELGAEPDGLNINEHFGSTHPEVLQRIILAESADLGIAFDGDGDRVIMVDHHGEVVDGDELLFIMAQAAVKQGRITGGVVGTIMSNQGLEQGIRQLGLDFIRTAVGDRYVIEALYEQGWLLGGEASGHIIWRGATTTGDGIVAALQVLAAMKSSDCSLHELKQGMHKWPQSLLNIRVSRHRDALQDSRVREAVRSVEGQLAGRGRVLIRPSGTEPLIRIMVEGEDNREVNQLAQELAKVVEQAAAI